LSQGRDEEIAREFVNHEQPEITSLTKRSASI